MAEAGGASLKEWLGVWLKDRLRYERLLHRPAPAHLGIANRNERLEAAPDGRGQACLWRFTSRLHAPSVQPGLGLRLLERCLEEAPIRRRSAPRWGDGPPELSVLIGHRGTERLPLLLATLESFAAQEDVRLECLVIEQDSQPRIAERLPAWVRHVHGPLSDPGAPYNRSHTFNLGARQARAPVLLLHDNDMLVPAGYGRRLLERVARGYAVVNPKRFVFYLDEDHSARVLDGSEDYGARPAEAIVQNLEAGGSMAITAEAYAAIGGHGRGLRRLGWRGQRVLGPLPHPADLDLGLRTDRAPLAPRPAPQAPPGQPQPGAGPGRDAAPSPRTHRRPAARPGGRPGEHDHPCAQPLQAVARGGGQRAGTGPPADRNRDRRRRLQRRNRSGGRRTGCRPSGDHPGDPPAQRWPRRRSPAGTGPQPW